MSAKIKRPLVCEEVTRDVEIGSDTVKIKLLILLSGFILGAAVIGVAWLTTTITETLTFAEAPVILSTQDMRDHIRREGFTLPKNATDIRYHWVGAIDYDCWFAFSDTAAALATFIENEKQSGAVITTDKTPPQRPPPARAENSASPWWPITFDDCDIYRRGLHTWLAHDRQRNRVYVYTGSM